MLPSMAHGELARRKMVDRVTAVDLLHHVTLVGWFRPDDDKGFRSLVFS